MANKEKAVKPNRKDNIKSKASQTGHGIMKIAMLLVVISGVYAVYVVSAGTQGIEPKIMVSPLAAWLAIKLIHAFTT